MPSYRAWYNYANGASGIGDWLRIVALNWIVVNQLHGDSVDNLTRIATCSAVTLLASFLPVRLHCAAVMLVANSYAGLSSGLMAWMLATGTLTVKWVFILELISGFLAAFSGPAGDQFYRNVFGLEQVKSNFITSHFAYLGRFAAGCLLLPCATLGSWMMLVIDAVSFVPLLFVFAWGCVYNIYAREEVELRPNAKVTCGLRSLLSTARHRVFLVIWLLLTLCWVLPFWLAPEVIGKDLGASLETLSIWLSLTGVAGVFGNVLAHRLCSTKALSVATVYVVFILGSVATIAAIGLTPTVAIFLPVYCAHTFLSVPVESLTAAYVRQEKDTADISRALVVLRVLLNGMRLGILALCTGAGLTAQWSLVVFAVLVLLGIILTITLARSTTAQLFATD